jgi:hypothetical protein
MRFEVLLNWDMASRGRDILEAMVKAAPSCGVSAQPREFYKGARDVLMTYGIGHPERRQNWLAHLKSGRHVVGWDLGYWQREKNGDAAMRVTIDADHPQQWIREEPAHRWEASRIELRNDWNRKGPIVLTGMGMKSRQVAGETGQSWELRTFRAIRAAYPGREVVYRPKKPTDALVPGCRMAAAGPIEDVIRGASLLVCRHSNTAIDACIAGIPVVCEDGIAAALYGSNIAEPLRPTREERLRFLHSAAFWQWKPSEAALAWKYIRGRLGG